MDEDVEVERVRALFPQAEKLTHGGKTVVLIPKAKFPGGGSEQEMDLLLYPHSGLGYPTRLFYEQQLNVGQNWTQHTICQETWWAPSFDGVRPDLHWDQILTRLLRAVK
jgi:hypothetical protein